MPPPDTLSGVQLLTTLPGVHADSATAHALELLEAAMDDGDTCIDLTEAISANTADIKDLTSWQQSLLASGLCTEGDGDRPFILDGPLLSSRRFWHYERSLAQALVERATDLANLDQLSTDQAVAADLMDIFPAQAEALVNGVDWQRLAGTVALSHNLSVVTGGPGTGKTTVAGKTIALAARMADRANQAFRVIIAAPTGKAAQRLRESLVSTGRGLVERNILSQDQLTALTSQVATLHRLLRDRQLPNADLVVIDEVSMADAATLARVIARIPRHAKIMLLGDPQQLASVDAGHVLGEIAKLHVAAVTPGVQRWYHELTATNETVAATSDAHPLGLAHVHLEKNWRSAASPAVTALAQALHAHGDQVEATFVNPAYQRTSTTQAPTWIERCDCVSAPQVTSAVLANMNPWIANILQASTPSAALAAHHTQRILCARRTSALGSEAINAAIEFAATNDGLIRPWENGHYHGQPVLVTRNDYDLQLFNGDIGIIWGDRHQAQAWFETSTGDLRPVPLQRLHGIESVFAMTIHKSQGSQFDHTEIITALDDEGTTGDLLTRELLYTAVTRSAFSARVWANADLLQRTIARRKWRRTGLGRFLTKPPASHP